MELVLIQEVYTTYEEPPLKVGMRSGDKFVAVDGTSPNYGSIIYVIPDVEVFTIAKSAVIVTEPPTLKEPEALDA